MLIPPTDDNPEKYEDSSVEREVYDLSLEKFLWNTAGMFDELEALFDDDLVWVHLNGHISTKGEWLSMLRSRVFV
ncbi:MAG: hypothetical protein REI11_10995 [Patulibacter sp.]|nr:hypothetical protein [Patulibacter sp.]